MPGRRSANMIGQVYLGRYRTAQSLGRGSMGQVFLAHDLREPRYAVVKLMRGHIAADPHARALFAREMKVMAQFRHPHAVEFYGASADDPPGPCIVMEYVPGVGLDRVLARHRFLHPERAGALLTQLCMALHAAHGCGIVHRDLKPANLMVIDPDVPGEFLKVLDLGLAQLAAQPYLPLEQFAGAADVRAVGTPAYLSPEQLRGDPTDHRADLYSLGVVLFEALTGRLPFDDEDVRALLNAHVRRPPPTFKEVGMGILPRPVEDVVRDCLAKFPVERPQSALELARRFRRALGYGDDLDPRAFAPAAGAFDAGAEPRPVQGSGRHRLVETLEAFMPEPIAVVKLRGFLEDAGGRALESEPGRIVMRLEDPTEPARPSGLFGWLRRERPAPSGPPPAAPVIIDLHMTRVGGPSQNRLELTVVFRAPSGPIPDDRRWLARVERLMADLRAYVMAQR